MSLTLLLLLFFLISSMLFSYILNLFNPFWNKKQYNKIKTDFPLVIRRILLFYVTHRHVTWWIVRNKIFRLSVSSVTTMHLLYPFYIQETERTTNKFKKQQKASNIAQRQRTFFPEKWPEMQDHQWRWSLWAGGREDRAEKVTWRWKDLNLPLRNVENSNIWREDKREKIRITS